MQNGTPFFDPRQPVGIWHGNLPHMEQTGKVTFVTFRLCDSMPQVIVNQFKDIKKEFLRTHPQPWTSETYKLYASVYTAPMERYVDAGYGSCLLKYPEVRKYLVDAIDYYDNERYLVYAYVIMPNHVHMLVSVAPGYELNALIASIKRYSAVGINRHTGRTGRLWQDEPFDTIIRSSDHYRHTVAYIRENPKGLPEGTYQFGGLEFKPAPH